MGYALISAMTAIWFMALSLLIVTEPERVILFCRIFAAVSRGLLSYIIL